VVRQRGKRCCLFSERVWLAKINLTQMLVCSNNGSTWLQREPSG
jgi:hypothetical protein